MSEAKKSEFLLQIPVYDDCIIVQNHKDNLPKDIELPEFADAGFWKDENGTLHMWLSERINTWRTIPHECVHIANRILAERNVVYYPTQDEALAYLVGFLCFNVNAAYNQMYGKDSDNEEPVVESEKQKQFYGGREQVKFC